MPSPANWCAAIAVLCLSLLLAGYLYERHADRRERAAHPAPGRLVSVGGHRLHLHCTGNGEPTVVIEQGAGEPSQLWWAVQDRVSAFAKVCTYDRAGYGWSDDAPRPRSIDDRVADLHALLGNAGLTAPFVLVGHSYGGLIVRRYAEKYPELTAGLVLVDTAEESSLFEPAVLKLYSRMRGMLGVVRVLARIGVLRLLARHFSLAAIGFPFVRAVEYDAAADDLSSVENAPAWMRVPRAPGAFGDLPLAVMTHGLQFPGPFAVLESGWSDGQARLKSLSNDGELILAANSNHMIQNDEPDLVVATIRRIHSAAQRGAVHP